MGTHVKIEGIKNLEEKLEKIISMQRNAPEVRVGIVKSAKYSGLAMKGRPQSKREPPLVAQVAFWNEFGTKSGGFGGRGIPSRPFMRQSVEAYKKDKDIKMFWKELGFITDPVELNKSAMLLGQRAKDIMVQMFTDGNFEANSPVTIKFKTQQGVKGGRTTPLIDTNKLWESVNFQVVDGKTKRPKTTRFG